MEVKAVFQADRITDLAKKRFQEERELNHLEGWFLAKEIQRECDETYKNEEDCIRIARTQVEVMKRIPLTLENIMYLQAHRMIRLRVHMR